MTDLIQRNQYGANYIPDFPAFREQVRNKTVIPHQVEFQPGPAKGTLCWLSCPYCYGGAVKDTGERLSKDRAIEILNQIADGGVKKVIFAGYCTDPLNCEYIEDLFEVAIGRKMTWGFNTKALRVSKRFLKLLSSPDIAEKSYISVSVDAGNSKSYNRVHSHNSRVISGNTYEHIWKNVFSIAKARDKAGFGVHFDISATYLINKWNNNKDEIKRFITGFWEVGCDLIRFTFPQPPRNTSKQILSMIPTMNERRRYRDKLLPIIEAEDSECCRVMLVDADTDYDIHSERTLPCVARWVYPTVGFDGWLYHCSQSSAPNFRPMALGDLNKRDFWDVFYDYTGRRDEPIMDDLGCRCDRKGHLVNRQVAMNGGGRV